MSGEQTNGSNAPQDVIEDSCSVSLLFNCETSQSSNLDQDVQINERSTVFEPTSEKSKLPAIKSRLEHNIELIKKKLDQFKTEFIEQKKQHEQLLLERETLAKIIEELEALQSCSPPSKKLSKKQKLLINKILSGAPPVIDSTKSQKVTKPPKRKKALPRGKVVKQVIEETLYVDDSDEKEWEKLRSESVLVDIDLSGLER